MYVRVAQFEGANPATLDHDMEQVRQVVRMESAPEGMPEETFSLLRDSVKRVLSLADRQTGATVDLVFTETEEAARRVHEALDAMTPPDGAGRRTSAGTYEVMIDEQLG